MTYGKISPKYQLVIPKEVRETFKIKPGQRLMIISKGNIIHLIPELSLQEMKGRLKGMNISDVRDEDERL